MLRTLAALCLLAAGFAVSGQRCKQRELEPNGSWPYANPTGTLPASSPQTVCGSIAGPDEDWWRIALDYQTSSLVEGKARLTLKAKSYQGLLTLRLYEKAFGGGLHYLGSWTTIGGWLDTGPLGLAYYKSGGFDVLYAAVNGAPGTTDYFLSFW